MVIAIPFILVIAEWYATGELDIIGWIIMLTIVYIFFYPFLSPFFMFLPSKKTDEAAFKNKIMKRFLEVFGQFGWIQSNISVIFDKDYCDNIVFPRSVNAYFDDYIQGFYKDRIEVTLNECQTEKLALFHIIPAAVWMYIFALMPSIAIIFRT